MSADASAWNRCSKLLSRALGTSAVMAVLSISGPVSAFTLDGILTTGSGADSYSEVFDLTFELDGRQDRPDKTVMGGQVRIGRDGPAGDVFILVEVPIDVVDNVYGTSARTDGSGWTRLDKNGNVKRQGHSLSDLLESDKLEFDLATNSGSTAVSVNYNDVDTDGIGVKGYATSLQFNLERADNNVAGFGDRTNSPDPIAGAPAADWVQAVQYEMQFDGSLFDAGRPVPTDLANFFLHASPNKGKYKNKVKVSCTDDCTPTTTTTSKVPEPGTVGLLGIGLLGLALYRRRREALTA